MKSYYRVMLAKKSGHAPECFAGGFIGTEVQKGSGFVVCRASAAELMPSPYLIYANFYRNGFMKTEVLSFVLSTFPLAVSFKIY